MYASAKTLVRPSSVKKYLISELETALVPMRIYGWALTSVHPEKAFAQLSIEMIERLEQARYYFDQAASY
jgi:hypothetical protein